MQDASFHWGNDHLIGHVYVLSLLADPTADKSVRQLQRLYYQYMQRMLSLPDAKKSWRELENFSHDLFRSTRMDDNVSPKWVLVKYLGPSHHFGFLTATLINLTTNLTWYMYYRTGGKFRGWKISCNSRFCLI